MAQSPFNFSAKNKRAGLQQPVFNAADAMYADTVPYFPSQKYIDKNLAPEQFPKESVKAAARAARKAVDAGILTPETATMILPNILTEGRPDDFGVNNGRWTGGVNSPMGKFVRSLGLDDTISKQDVSLPLSVTDLPRKLYNKGDVVIMPKSGDNPAELDYNARLMAAVLAEKQRQSKDSDSGETIRRWNGQGKGAENHLRKVIEASEMLVNNEGNKQIMDLFKQEFMKDPVPQDPTKGTF